METVEKKVFRSYYYDFESTGVECVDKILCWLARAGKAYHHTESWSEEQAENDSPDSFIGVIQKSADSAASRLTAVEAALMYPQSHGELIASIPVAVTLRAIGQEETVRSLWNRREKRTGAGIKPGPSGLRLERVPDGPPERTQPRARGD